MRTNYTPLLLCYANQNPFMGLKVRPVIQKDAEAMPTDAKRRMFNIHSMPNRDNYGAKMASPSLLPLLAARSLTAPITF